MTPFRIGHIDHIVLRVVDLQAMLDFYQRVLGCTVEKVQEDLGLYQLRAGDSLIDLVPVGGRLGKAGGGPPARDGRNLDHVCLSIEPFDAQALLEHLGRHGVAHGEVARRYGAQGEGPSIYLTDPEGNTVELKGSLGA